MCYGWLLGTLLLSRAAVGSEHLVFTGATFFDPPFYGLVMTPSGKIFRVEEQFHRIATLGIANDDVVVYFFEQDRFEVHPDRTPSDLLQTDPEFSAFQLLDEISVYSEATLSYKLNPSAEELDEPGALIHLGPQDLRLRGFGSPGTGGVEDYDNDGIPDIQDNCPAVPNSEQTNNDGDDHGDACDADDDNDGLPDADEIGVYGTDPFDPDSDGDGLGDGIEVFSGLDPRDPGNCPPEICSSSSVLLKLVPILMRQEEAQ